MIHLVTLNPALDFSSKLQDSARGKIGKLLESGVEAGGKALNIARFLKQWKVPFVTWLGTGGGEHPTHVLYRSLLKKEGLETNFLSAEAPIRFNMVVGNKKKSKKYNHDGFPLEPSVFFKLLPAVQRTDRVVLTGRLPKGMKDSTYADWIEVFNKRGVQTVVDSSGKPLELALKAKPWFLKVNLIELSEAIRRKLSSLKQVTPLIAGFRLGGLFQGAITNGSDGAILWNGVETLWVKSSAKTGKSLVVGAGDAFLAGYLKGLSAQKSFADCAKLACASGAVVAASGIKGFNLKDVSTQLKQVKLLSLRGVN